MTKQQLKEKRISKSLIINKDKYPELHNYKESFEFGGVFYDASKYVITGYFKNDVLFFYTKLGYYKFKFCNLKITKLNYYFFDAFREIEEFLIDAKYKGKIGFECCELNQLNKLVEVMIKKYNVISYRENENIIIDYDYENVLKNNPTRPEAVWVY